MQTDDNSTGMPDYDASSFRPYPMVMRELFAVLAEADDVAPRALDPQTERPATALDPTCHFVRFRLAGRSRALLDPLNPD